MGTDPASAPPVDHVFSLLRAGRVGDAVALAARLAREAPASAPAQHAHALALATAGDLEGADAAFRRALERAPRDPAILGNHAVLLRKAGRHDAAIAQLRVLVQAHPAHAQAWLELGQTQLRRGDADAARAALENCVRLAPDAALAWHLLGNACRDLGRTEDAERAFRTCIACDPGQWTAWFNLACVLRLDGRPDEAVAIHRRLIAEGHAGPDVLDACAGALLDTGDVEAALGIARRAVREHPGHVPVQVTLAHLQWEHGDTPEEAVARFRAAVDASPGDHALRAAFARWMLASGRAQEAVEQAAILVAAAPDPELMLLQADALAAAGESVAAGALYGELHARGDAHGIAALVPYARHLLRSGDPARAAAVATEATRADPASQEAWAYLGTAWRLLGDARAEWLCDVDRLVGVIDAGFPPDADQHAVRESLERLHRARREPRQQSVRGGTQTAGRLLQRRDPVLAAVRRHLLGAVEGWLATLPVDAAHPVLSRNRGRVALGGSWSVRLASAGRHTDHIHPEGWISSAFYVALPPSVRNATPGTLSGCIRFGQPPAELGLDLPALRVVRPQEGRLVLFPSYMWHGTEPFQDAAPRLTIAFDMTPACEPASRA